MIRWACLLAQLLILGADAAALTRLSGRLAVFLPAHALLCALYCLAFARCVGGSAPRASAALLGLVLSLYLPVCGMACGALLTLLMWWMPRPKGDLLLEFKEHTTLPEYRGLGPTSPTPERLIAAARGIEPLVDMVLSSDLKTKRAALEAIAKRRNPNLMSYLLSALRDPRPEIYQYAMSQVLNLQARYGGEIAKAEAALRTSGGLEERRRLAGAYEQYLRSGLADQAVRALYRGRLEQAYWEILKLAPRDAEVYAALGKLHLQSRRWDQAKDAFLESRRLEPNTLETRFGLVEVLYAMGDHRAMGEELKSIVADLASEEGEASEPARLAQWWLSGEEGVPA